MQMIVVQLVVVGREHDAEEAAGAVAHVVQEYSARPRIAPVSGARS